MPGYLDILHLEVDVTRPQSRLDQGVPSVSSWLLLLARQGIVCSDETGKYIGNTHPWFVSGTTHNVPDYAPRTYAPRYQVSAKTRTAGHRLEKEPRLLHQPLETKYLCLHRTNTSSGTDAIHTTIILPKTKHIVSGSKTSHPHLGSIAGTTALSNNKMPRPSGTRPGSTTFLQSNQAFANGQPTQRHNVPSGPNSREDKATLRTNTQRVLPDVIQCAGRHLGKRSPNTT